MDLSNLRLASDRRLFSGVRRSFSTVAVDGLSARAPGKLTTRSPLTEGDAVAVSLRAPPRQSSGTQSSAAVAPPEPGVRAPQSGLRQLLKSLDGVTNRIAELQDTLRTTSEGSARAEKILGEITELSTEYTRILGGDQATKLQEILGSVENSLRSGVSTEALARALAPEGALLGEDLLSLVQSGSLSGLRSVANNIGTLSNIARAGLTDSSTSLTAARKAIDETYAALNQSLRAPTQQSKTVIAESKPFIPPPVPVDFSLQGSGDLALKLRTYIGEDAIQAALAHLPFDPTKAIVLVAPEHNEERERVRRSEEDRKRQSDLKLDRSQRPRRKELGDQTPELTPSDGPPSGTDTNVVASAPENGRL